MIITDPVFSERASPLAFIGPARVRRAGVALDQLPPIDLVLLSHNHYDHCDLASLRSTSTSRCCRLAPTSRGGSWDPFT